MYYKIEVNAGASEEFLKRTGTDSFTASVKVKAEQNQANRRLLGLLKREFPGRRMIVRIVSGHHSPHKIVSIEEAVEAR